MKTIEYRIEFDIGIESEDILVQLLKMRAKNINVDAIIEYDKQVSALKTLAKTKIITPKKYHSSVDKILKLVIKNLCEWNGVSLKSASII